MLLRSGINNDNERSQVCMAVEREREGAYRAFSVNTFDNCICCRSDRQRNSPGGILRHILRPVGQQLNTVLRFSFRRNTYIKIGDRNNEPYSVYSVGNGTKRWIYSVLQLLQGRVDPFSHPVRLEFRTEI